MERLIQPLLAAPSMAEIITVIIVVVGLIFRLVQYMSQGDSGKTGPPVPPPPRRPKDGSLQQEIDIFLQEVSPQGSPGTTAPAKAPRGEQARRASSGSTARGAESKGRRTAKKVAEDAARRRHAMPGAEIAARKAPGRQKFGDDVSQHVAEHLPSQSLAQRTQDEAQNRVQQSVSQHLGQVSAKLSASAPPDTTGAVSAARQFRELLKRPEHVRQAILVNEILSRPIALRRSSG